MDLLAKFKCLEALFVKQRPNMQECAGSCEVENGYYVFAGDDEGKIITSLPVLRCKEKSSCFSKCFLNADSRPFKMEIEHHANGPSSNAG